jgi:hypothetical protein
MLIAAKKMDMIDMNKLINELSPHKATTLSIPFIQMPSASR